jgi:riboflavin synthase alpha subunit
MQRNDEKLFCFFSGYAHKDITLLGCEENLNQATMILSCENNSKEYRLFPGEYIQLNGVLFEVIETESNHFKASTTMELFNNTSLRNNAAGDELNLGVLAEFDLLHTQLWMLQATSCGLVTYKKYSVQDGHEHTLKLDFEAAKEFDPIIKEDCHIGLAGCSLTVKEVKSESNLLKFSIYCGRETREHTQFNQNLPANTQVNLTAAAEVVDIATTARNAY